MEPGSFRTLSLTTKVVPWHKCTPEKHYKSRPLPVSTSMLFFELRPQQLFAYAGLLSQEGNHHEETVRHGNLATSLCVGGMLPSAAGALLSAASTASGLLASGGAGPS
jgi:hypothetical protein